MSLKSREVRRLTLAGATALIAAGAVAAPAGAATTGQLTYNCVYPLVDGQPLVADVSVDLPSSVAAGAPTGEYQINVTAHALGQTWDGLGLAGIGKLSGTAVATASATTPGGSTQILQIPINVQNTTVPFDDPGTAGVTILADGKTPSLNYPYGGVSNFSVDALKMNIRGLSLDDEPIALGTANDSDKDPNTFDVSCSGPPVAFGSINVTGTAPPSGNADTVAPTKPGAPVASGLTTTSAKLDWAASTDNVGVSSYDVYQNGTKVQTVNGTTATLVGLTPSTSYTVYVVAKDAAGNASTASATTTVATPAPAPTIVNYNFALKGTSQLKTLTTGTLPVTGAVKAAFDVGAGTYKGTTVLGDSPASLKAIGFLPISAVIGFTEVGGTTGTLGDGVLTANTNQDIRLKSVKSLGISLVSGNCHTKTPSAIALKSTTKFLPTVGGPIAGSYDIAPLTGCGLLNGLVSGLTSGKGNTLALTLTPQA